MSDPYDNEMTAVFRDAARFRHLQKGLSLSITVPTPTEEKPNKKVTVLYGPNPEEGWGAALAEAVDKASGAAPGHVGVPFCPICGAEQEKTTCVAERQVIPYGQNKSLSVIVPVHHCSACKESWTDYQTEAIRDLAVKEAMAADCAADGAATANAWQEAMLDKLALCCGDAAVDMPPAEILDRIISWHVNVALDPGVSARVHLAHCHQGDHANACKYGDADCPAAPVAWRRLSDGSGPALWEYGDRPQTDDAQPLYPHPLARPLAYLTDEVIRHLDDETMFHESPDWSLRFARKVLAAASVVSGQTLPQDTELSEYWSVLCRDLQMPWIEKMRAMIRRFGTNGAPADAARTSKESS